jgi:hypothetical protein
VRRLEHQYPDELAALERLFGPAEVREKLPRLNEIYRYTEKKWDEYIKKIPECCINYLLIAEAPSWKNEGIPKYVLDPDCEQRTLLRALRATFMMHNEAVATSADILRLLARQGWLIVDSTPFAMKYQGKRNRKAYRELIALTVKTYMNEKLRHPHIKWSRNVKVAFSLKLNALAVISGLKGNLQLDQVALRLSRMQIAANDAGYPHGKFLKRVYGLDKGRITNR